MDFKEISELVKLVNKSNLIELKIKDGDFEISMRTENMDIQKRMIRVKSFWLHNLLLLHLCSRQKNLCRLIH
ncbi:MAG: hypothetical protein IPL46_11740 [Saprospiraceae bacterium]|nr:hypothetical protein [Saprospiraceae bacterium]